MCSELWSFETMAVFTFLPVLPGLSPYEKASIKPLPIRVEVMFRQRKMYPIVPIPPNSPFFGTNLQGPSSKKLAIPLAAEIREVTNVAKNKENKGSMLLNPKPCCCPVINLGFCAQRQSRMCTCGTLSMRGSEMYNLL